MLSLITNALVNYVWEPTRTGNTVAMDTSFGPKQRPQAFKALLSAKNPDDFYTPSNPYYRDYSFQQKPPSGLDAITNFFNQSKKEAHDYRSTLHQVAYDLKSALPDNNYLHSQFKKKFFWQLLTATPVSREEIKNFFAEHKITAESLSDPQKFSPLEIETSN